MRSNFGAGCAVLAVTVAADSAELLDKAAAVFQSWREKLALRLAEGGVPERADELATLLVSSSEGAVVLSRAARSLEPFDTVARVLLSLFPSR